MMVELYRIAAVGSSDLVRLESLEIVSQRLQISAEHPLLVTVCNDALRRFKQRAMHLGKLERAGRGGNSSLDERHAMRPVHKSPLHFTPRGHLQLSQRIGPPAKNDHGKIRPSPSRKCSIMQLQKNDARHIRTFTALLERLEVERDHTIGERPR